LIRYYNEHYAIGLSCGKSFVGPSQVGAFSVIAPAALHFFLDAFPVHHGKELRFSHHCGASSYPLGWVVGSFERVLAAAVLAYQGHNIVSLYKFIKKSS